MTFPAVVNSATTTSAADLTTHPLNLPANLVAGNLLVAIVGLDGNAGGITPPAGWSSLVPASHDGGTNVWIAAFWRISDGLEGASTTYTSTNAQFSCAICYQIHGHDPAQAPEGAAQGSAGTANAANPPALTPTGGANDYLWIVGAAKDTGDNSFTSVPTGYTGGAHHTGGANPGGGVGLGYATRERNAETEDPDAFGMAETEQWVAITLAIYPAEGGTPSPAITDVDTDETVTAGQTVVAVTGTNMGADETERVFTLRQGSVAVTQTETGTGTETAATLSIVTETGGADLKFGSATLRCTRTADSAFGELAITVEPSSGELYVDIGTPDPEADNRITAVPDIASGDQLHARGAGGGAAPAGLQLRSDGTFWFASGSDPAAFDVRVWDASDATWGAFATQIPEAAGGGNADLSGAGEFGASFGAVASTVASFTAGVGISEASVDALAQAADAITAGLAAGEIWAVHADAAATLAAQGNFAAEFLAMTQGAQSAALAAGTSAASSFIAAAQTLAAISAGATLSDAIVGITTSLGQLTAGASFGATFAFLSGNQVLLTAGVSAGHVLAVVAAARGSLLATTDADALFAAQAVSAAALAAGATFGAAFSASGGLARVLPPASRRVRVAAPSRTVIVRPRTNITVH